MQQSMAASHAIGKGNEADAVFSVLKKANDALKQFGRDRVVNGSIGAIYGEDEEFATLPTVEQYYRQISSEELMSYAPISGLPEFLQATIDFTFLGYLPDNVYVKSVATPGGTGAIRHVFHNYLEQGQKALIPDWFWGAYKTIAEEHSRGIETYQMFDAESKFTLKPLKDKVKELLQSQDQLVVVFNTPAHNPTGHSLSMLDWEDVITFLKNCAEDKKKKIVILLDLAYIDYAGTPEETRGFMKLFGDLPANILVTLAYSMSKSFLMYGVRSGALIGLSSVPEVIDEFAMINSYSNRGVWSNGARGAQKLLGEINANPQLRQRADEERDFLKNLINKRAMAFLKEAEAVGLPTTPYHSGFFITVPALNPPAVCDKLAQNNIFVVPLKKGLRIAVCSIPTHKIPGLATKTKEALTKN